MTRAAKIEEALLRMLEWHMKYHGEEPCSLCVPARAALASPPDDGEYRRGFADGVERAAQLLDEWVARPAGGEGQNALVDAMVRSAEDMVRILAERIRALARLDRGAG